jgi:hypothetical protein
MNAPRSDWHRVGAGLSVRLELRTGQVHVEWMPRTPTRKEWRRIEDRYRSARNTFLAEVARELGRDVVCIEVTR